MTMSKWEAYIGTTGSAAVDKALLALEKNKGVPRVNLPALARRDERFMECWEADKDHVFISSDFSSLEPSITAHFSQDKYYKYATFDGIGKRPWIDRRNVLMIDDIYLMTASVMPGISEHVLVYFGDPKNCDNWEKDPEICKEDPKLKPYRKQAKPACLGFNYGMGPKRFVNQCYDAGMDISHDQATGMYKAYWELYSGIKLLTKKLEAYLAKNKFIENPFGYRLTTDPYKGYNAFIQSSASGVVDILSRRFFDKCPYATFIAYIHDEIIYQVPSDKEDEAKRIQDECVIELNKDLNFTIPMRLGFQVGRTFKELK
jgi:DNA polymerase I-like protein with 3'-5' exonuclease and polymerase domains